MIYWAKCTLHKIVLNHQNRAREAKLTTKCYQTNSTGVKSEELLFCRKLSAGGSICQMSQQGVYTDPLTPTAIVSNVPAEHNMLFFKTTTPFIWIISPHTLN